MKMFFNLLTLICLPLCNLTAQETLAFGDTTLLDSPYEDHQIEVYVKKGENPNFKPLLFLHGASGKGLKGISEAWFNHWYDKGYAIIAISMPGYGESTGMKDFCGPKTLKTLHFAIDVIKNKWNFDDFGIMGFGQGGLAGALLASQRDDVRCLVITNCGYDLLRHQILGDPLLGIIEEKDYDFDIDDEEALRLRSPILFIQTIETPVFLLHRAGNPIISGEEVIDFYKAMLEENKECYLSIIEKTPGKDEQILSYEEVLSEAESWVDSMMKLEH